jgi:hypothetical protein
MNLDLTTLDALGAKHGTDKCSKPILRDAQGWGKNTPYDAHNYLCKYEVFFSPLRQCEFTLCEIGIGRGRSLRLWKDYFPNAMIHGIDIRPECKVYEEERITIHILDGESPKTADYMASAGLKPLLLIEDGSHTFKGQKTALESLFPLLQPSGYYIVEDLELSLSRQMNDYLKGTIGGLTLYDHDLWGKYSRFKVLQDQERYLENNMEFITFIPTAACLIKKRMVEKIMTIQPSELNFNIIQHNELVEKAFLQLHLNKLPALAVCNGDKFIGIIARDDINHYSFDCMSAPVGDYCNKNPKMLHSFEETPKDSFLYHPFVVNGIFLGFRFEF